MDDSFKVRVERLFGARLFESVPRSSFSDSSWTVNDGEVERKEWNRERGGDFPDREEIPCASSYDECFAKNRGRPRVPRKHRFEDDVGDIDDGEEEETEEGGEEEGEGAESEDSEIRSSIGLDPTLDYEEEEDEYDRAAVGCENASERMYMRDVNDHGPYMNYHTIIEDSGEDVLFARDPRADHLAASARLKEDKAVGVGLQLDSTPIDTGPKTKVPESDVNLKPILKRKSNQVDSRPKKQVRFGDFGLACKDYRVEQLSDSQDLLTVPGSTDATGSAETSEDSPSVPDYVRNPSKYVRYTFHSEDDVNDELNRRALDDVWKIIRASKAENVQADAADGNTEPPKSVVFTPRKRAGEATTNNHTLRSNNDDTPKEPLKEPAHVVTRSLGIAAADAQGNEVCAMEEDSMDIPVEKSVAPQKSGRQYRSRTHSDDSAY